MSFFDDGRLPTGPFHHSEAGFAMNPYPHHEQQPSLAAAPAAHPGAYPYVDASGQTHMYHRQSYGDVAPAQVAALDHGGWYAPPHAPRLSAAAARAGRRHMMGYAPPGYPQQHGATAWYAEALAGPYPQQQPRTHQQLEHQLLVQHHLAKAHERQNAASMYQPAYAQSAYPSQPQHNDSSRHNQQPHHYYPSQIESARAAAHDAYADRQPRYHHNWSQDGYHAEGQPANYDARDWSAWHQASSAHRGSMPYLPQHGQMYSTHPAVQAGHRHSDDASLHGSDAWAAHNVRTSHQPHFWDQASHHPQHAYADHSQASYHDLNAPSRPRYEDQSSHYARQQDRAHDLVQHHRDEHRSSQSGAWHRMHDEPQHAHANDLRRYNESNQWQPRAETSFQEAHAPVPEEPEQAPAQGGADQAEAPAPSSPDSLEKSAIPIAAIGAQLVWNACAALFDPELLTEAHETADEAMDEDGEESMSPGAGSNPSSSSTPSLNTPDISPWNSTVLDRSAADSASLGDWNAFRSPFGPDRMPSMRPQAHSFTFGSDNASTHHDLHRMAVGAERARSGSKRSRQVSGQSEAAAGHSSGVSTASSSEPGTPASLSHESPALSSTVSAHSVETTRAGLGMSLDRTQSESAIRARRSPSKVSPKLGSSKWSGRIRDNVLAVLRLVSPEWRWSNNNHQLVSLTETLVPASAAAATKAGSIQGSGRAGGRDSVTSIVTTYANEPSPAFRRFVHQVLAQTLLSPTAFLLGILNSLRLLTMAQLSDGTIDPVVLELFAQPTSAAPFKLFTLGMMIANKHLDDNTFLNKTWNEVTGIPLAELNQTEAWFLKKCNYEVTVPDETWIGFLNRLQTWEEKRSSRGMHRDHDSSKRLLLVLDEALGHFDAIPAFHLDGDMVNGVETGEKASSPMNMWTKSHHCAGSLALLDSDHLCRSAPAVATLHDDEDLDATKHHRSSHLSRASLATENASAALLRSNSDFKEFASINESGKSPSSATTGPLMPSALLNGSRSLFQHHHHFGPLHTGWAHH